MTGDAVRSKYDMVICVLAGEQLKSRGFSREKLSVASRKPELYYSQIGRQWIGPRRVALAR